MSEMKIKTFKVKQYNSTIKTVVMVNDEPVCICGSGQTLSTILSYLQGYSEVITDGKVKKRLDKVREEFGCNEEI